MEAWVLLFGVALVLALPPPPRLDLPPLKTMRGVTLADALVTVPPPESSGDTVAVSLGVTFCAVGFTALVIFGVAFLARVGLGVASGSCNNWFSATGF